MGLGSHVLSLRSIHRGHVLSVGHIEGPIGGKTSGGP